MGGGGYNIMYLSPRWVVQTSSTFLLLALIEELVKDSKRFRFDSKLFEIPTDTQTTRHEFALCTI